MKKPDVSAFVITAKYGCKWFRLSDKGEPLFLVLGPYRVGNLPPRRLPDSKHINHFAACTAIEWWLDEGSQIEDAPQGLYLDTIKALRAFKRERGIR